MVVTIVAFSVEDAFAKAVAGLLPVCQILVMFELGGALLFAGLAKLNNERLFTADVVSVLMPLNVLFKIVGKLESLLLLKIFVVELTGGAGASIGCAMEAS